MANLTLTQLKAHLFGAVDLLRSRMVSSDHLLLILGMLFLKRTSDLFVERRRQVLTEMVSAGHSEKRAEVIAETPEPYRGVFFVPAKARWSYLREELRFDIGHGLNNALRAIEFANPTLRGALPDIDFNRVDRQTAPADCILRDLIEHFSGLGLANDQLGERDLLGSACDDLLNSLAASPAGRSDLLRTSRDLTRMMVRIADPTDGMRLYDPCCGTGGLLVASYQHIINQHGNSGASGIFAHDIHEKACSIAKLNTLLHGIPDAQVVSADALFHPMLKQNGELMRFDRVLTNPPLGRRRLHKGAELRLLHLLPVSSTELIFVQHIASLLRLDGLGAVVTTYTALYHGGREEAARNELIERDQIDAVIGLGPGLLPYTRIPVCVLILRAKDSKPVERKGKVIFIDASRIVEASEGNRPSAEQVDKILEIWQRFIEVPQIARVVDHAEISAHSFDLNPQRWQLVWQLDRVKEVYPEFRVGELGDLAGEIRTVKKGATRSQDGNFIYFSRTAKPLLEENLFDSSNSAVSDAFRADLPASIIPGYLHAFLESDLGAELAKSVRFGTAHGVTSIRGMQRLILAIPDLEMQRSIAGTRDRLRTFRSRIDELHAQLAVDLSDYAAVNQRVSQAVGLMRAVATEDQVQLLITQGESLTLEFKETLGWDARTNRKSKSHMEAALKAVVALLNTNGGHLLVGVTDQGQPAGMRAEIEATYGSPDRLLQAWTNSLRDRVGTKVMPLIEARIVTVQGEPLLLSECKAASDPCFLDDKHFFARMNASSQHLEGPKLVDYVQSRFPTQASARTGRSRTGEV